MLLILQLGISPNIIDQILLESFSTNSKLTLCTLVGHDSNANDTTSDKSLLSLLPEVYSNEILITMKPKKLFSLVDLRESYLAMQKCKCCFNLDEVDVIRTIDSDEFIYYHVVEVALSKQARDIHIVHDAVETVDNTYTLCPSLCHKCCDHSCENCDPALLCDSCEGIYCFDCVPVWFCHECKLPKCIDCSESTTCEVCSTSECNECSIRLWDDEDTYFAFCSLCEILKCLKCGPFHLCDVLRYPTCNECVPIFSCSFCSQPKCEHCEPLAKLHTASGKLCCSKCYEKMVKDE